MKKIVQKLNRQFQQFAPGFLPQTPPLARSRPDPMALLFAIRRC